MTRWSKDTILLGSFGEVTELAEGARLESVCILTGYPGFESPPLRHFDVKAAVITVAFFVSGLIFIE